MFTCSLPRIGLTSTTTSGLDVGSRQAGLDWMFRGHGARFGQSTVHIRLSKGKKIKMIGGKIKSGRHVPFAVVALEGPSGHGA